MSPRLRTLGCALLLLAGNVYICLELFVTEYHQHMFSIECTHITVARWIAEHAGELGWFPLWYEGTPFHLTYPPLLPSLVAAGVWLTGASPALSYHALTAALYCLGAVSLFWFAFALSGRRWLALLAGLFYSVLAPADLFLPGAGGFWEQSFTGRRFAALVPYGEGPHIASLFLIPLALLALRAAVRHRGIATVLTAAVMAALVALTNWIGTFAFAVAAAVLLLSELDRDWPRQLGAAVTAGVLGYAMASPWIPPSNIAIVRRNAQMFVGDYPMGAAQYQYLAVLGLIVVVVVLLLRRTGAGELVRFSLLYFLAIGGVSVSRAWFGFYALPQPERYYPEMEMAFVLLLAWAVYSAVERLSAGGRRKPVVAVAVALCVLIVWIPGKRLRRTARNSVRPIDITETLEYQVADWMKRNMPGQRLFAMGSTQFWFNVFTDNPQLKGAADQAVYNPELPAVWFAIPFLAGNGAVSAAWLQAYGVGAVATSGPNSRDHYRDFHDPFKFDGVLERVWQQGDDVIYAVPRRAPSLVRVINPGDVLETRPPSFETAEPITTFARALAANPLPEVHWANPQHATIDATLDPGQLLYVQVAWHPGWRATRDGKPVPVRSDGLGQIVIEPGCSGPCSVQLTWSGGVEMTLARIACAGAIFLPSLFLFHRRRRARL